MKRLALATTVALIVAACGGDDQDSVAATTTVAPTSTTTTATTAAAVPIEFSPDVAITGDPLPVFEPGPEDAARGTIAPEVAAAGFDGSPLALSHDGAKKVVVFLAHWCSFCQAEVPEVTEWLDRTELPADVEFWSVVTNTTSERNNYPPSTWLAEAGWQPPVLVDSESSEIAQAYGLNAFPYWVVLDGDGTVLARTSGEVPVTALDELVTALEVLPPATERPPATPAEQAAAVTVVGDPLPLFGEEPDAAVGATIPSLTGTDYNGEAVAIDAANGTPKLVLVMAHWCGHCQREVPEVQAWIDQNGIPSDIDMVAVAAANSPDRGNYPASAWLEAEGWSVPVLIDDADDSAYLALGAPPFPAWILVDADGTVLARPVGAGAIDLDTALSQLRG